MADGLSPSPQISVPVPTPAKLGPPAGVLRYPGPSVAEAGGVLVGPRLLEKSGHQYILARPHGVSRLCGLGRGRPDAELVDELDLTGAGWIVEYKAVAAELLNIPFGCTQASWTCHPVECFCHPMCQVTHERPMCFPLESLQTAQFGDQPPRRRCRRAFSVSMAGERSAVLGRIPPPITRCG